jgi:Lon protease-like protein
LRRLAHESGEDVKSFGSQIQVPPQAPVMVLPNATLFPHTLLPLFIFEPRYRDMLAWSLEHHRMFCIALMNPGLEEARTTDEFHHIGGLGLIRACIGHEDGTSHLILQGLARVEMTEFVQERPFRMACLSSVSSEPPTPEEGEVLSAQILEYCAHFQAKGVEIPETLDEQLASVNDPAMLCDIVAHTFVRDPYRRQLVLEQTRVAERMKTLIRHLGEESM